MTIDEIKTCDREYLIPREIAPILGIDQQSIRVMARQCPERLGFTVAVIGTRTKIPRRAFLRWLEGQEAKRTKEVER